MNKTNGLTRNLLTLGLVITLMFPPPLIAEVSGLQNCANCLTVIPEHRSDCTGCLIDNANYSEQIQGIDHHITLDCYPVNHRHSYHSIGPNSVIVATFDLKDRGIFTVEYPATIFFYRSGTPKLTGAPQGSSIARANRTVAANLNYIVASANVTADGNYHITKIPTRIKALSLKQYRSDTRNIASSATNLGPLSGTVTNKISANGKVITSVIHVPGDIRYCGSFKSPLMLFFDGKRPSFSGKSSFPLDPAKRTIGWVEPKAPGYFLAFDRDGNGRIESSAELFGDFKTKNGFEALRPFDSDKNGKVDGADKDFTKLLLWADKNADGISQKHELVPLSQMGVQSISLHYKSDKVIPLAEKVEARQYGSFTFVDSKGNTKTGEVIDVWFSPYSEKASESRLAQSAK